MKKLTAIEMQVLELLAQGYENIEIAQEMYISYYTVKRHLQKIYKKLNVSCDRKAIAYYYEEIKHAS
ncbi:response regulator transcription factor [Wukongibacter sp. M2B1]|uniref:response regulator transcription factor n=1 Tax=Wukongibacter sp. M2B1 TaxID=3088895 RepID=UPI003D7B2951